MGRVLTKRYVDEVLEVSGVKRMGTERIQEISRASDEEVIGLLNDFAVRTENHYKKNLPSILEDLRALKGQPKAYYLGPGSVAKFNAENSNWFIRKSALYYNKIVVQDPLQELQTVKRELKPAAIKEDLMKELVSLSLLWPWIAEGIIEIIPSFFGIEGLAERIYRYSREDFQDTEGWLPQALKYEDLGLEGESYLREMENFMQKHVLPDPIEKMGGLRAAALRATVEASSHRMGRGFFGGWLTDSSPTTDCRQSWRLFGYWVLLRAEGLIAQELGRDRWESFVRNVKTGRAWLALDARELGVLSKLPPKKIIEIRDSADYSFRSFREDLGYAVDAIQGLKLDDEEAYREAANQAWSKVRDSAREVKKDSNRVKKTIGVEAGVLGMSLILGLLPFDIAKVATALIGTPTALDIAKECLELRELKKSTGYFLVRLEEST